MIEEIKKYIGNGEKLKNEIKNNHINKDELIENLKNMKYIQCENRNEEIDYIKEYIAMKQLLIYLEKDSEELKKLFDNILTWVTESKLDLNDLGYICCQFKKMLDDINDEKLKKITEQTYRLYLYNIISKFTVDSSHLRTELRNTDNVLILVKYYGEEDDFLTRIAKEVAYYSMNILGKNVVIINTNDDIYKEGIQLFFEYKSRNNEEVSKLDFIQIRDRKVQYVPCSNGIFNIEEADIIVNYVRNLKPGYVISIGDRNIVSMEIDKIIPTLTIAKEGNTYTTKYEQIIDENCDIENIKKLLNEYKKYADEYDMNKLRSIEEAIPQYEHRIWKTTEPLVSVATLTYNHEDFIVDALNSFLMQKTSFPFEVIVNDDCSTDLTGKIIKLYERKYPEIIKGIYQRENLYSKGVKISMDIIYPKCRGKYIAMCEGDDYWVKEDKLEKQVTYLENNDECSGVFHNTIIKTNNGLYEANQGRNNKERDFDAGYIILNSGAIIPTASIVCRKDVLLSQPRKLVEISTTGDFLLEIWIALKGKFHYMPEYMSVYRAQTDNSWTTVTEKNPRKMQEYVLGQVEWLLELNKLTGGKYLDEISYRIGKRSKAIVPAMQMLHPDWIMD